MTHKVVLIRNVKSTRARTTNNTNFVEYALTYLPLENIRLIEKRWSIFRKKIERKAVLFQG